MKRLFLILLFSLFLLPANATECSKYLSDLYTNECNCQVKIVSKNEHIDRYEQKIGEVYVDSIAYGMGYMKKKKCKKVRITYITLLDKDCNPIWGYVIPR